MQHRQQSKTPLTPKLRNENPVQAGLTLDLIQAWEASQLTQHLKRDIELYRKQIIDNVGRVGASMEATAMQAAYFEGFLDGIEELFNNVEELKDRLKGVA